MVLLSWMVDRVAIFVGAAARRDRGGGGARRLFRSPDPERFRRGGARDAGKRSRDRERFRSGAGADEAGPNDTRCLGTQPLLWSADLPTSIQSRCSERKSSLSPRRMARQDVDDRLSDQSVVAMTVIRRDIL